MEPNDVPSRFRVKDRKRARVNRAYCLTVRSLFWLVLLAAFGPTVYSLSRRSITMIREQEDAGEQIEEHVEEASAGAVKNNLDTHVEGTMPLAAASSVVSNAAVDVAAASASALSLSGGDWHAGSGQRMPPRSTKRRRLSSSQAAVTCPARQSEHRK